MDYYPFPALLRSKYNSIHEFGQASIAVSDNAIDFTSDFVPLLPLGCDAEIKWVLGNRVLAAYHGQVYLSSRELLRIVDIAPNKLEAARTIFATNTKLPGTAVATGGSRIIAKPPAQPVEILYLSKQLIKFRAGGYIAKGQRVALSCEVDFLTLNNQPLQVLERVLLQRDDAILVCEVLPGGDDNFVALSTYTARLAEQEKKQPSLGPPIP